MSALGRGRSAATLAFATERALPLDAAGNLLRKMVCVFSALRTH